MAETKIHSIRIPDDTWERARLVADHHGTTVSAMVVDFLKKVNYRAIPKITASSQAERQVGKGPREGISTNPERVERIRQRAKDPRRKIPREVCPHDVVKTIPYGIFCAGCGMRMPS